MMPKNEVSAGRGWASAGLVVVAVAVTLGGCSMHKMTGDTMVSYTSEEAIPYLMAQDDVEMGCELGVSMGGFLLSFERVGVDVQKSAIVTMLSAGMCSEAKAWEAELRRERALKQGNVPEAKDASYVEKAAHQRAALRNLQAFEATIAVFGDPNEACPEFESDQDQAIYLLGMASGALAVVHDRNADGMANVALDTPRVVERGAACLDPAKWWGMPLAIRAAIWSSIPGAGPKDADPWSALQEAAVMGDEQGVGMARGLLVQTARVAGREDLMCQAAAAHEARLQATPSNPDWVLLDAYATSMVRHEVNVHWTKAEGHRAAPDSLACFEAEEDADDGLLDDGDDDLFGDLVEEEPAASDNENEEAVQDERLPESETPREETPTP